MVIALWCGCSDVVSVVLWFVPPPPPPPPPPPRYDVMVAWIMIGSAYIIRLATENVKVMDVVHSKEHGIDNKLSVMV